MDYAEKLNQKDYMPSVILGDLNAFPESDELSPITKNPEYTDASKDIPVTFHGFFVCTKKIDYIFINKLLGSKACYIWEDREGKPCLSDHHPVCILAEFV